MVNTPDPMSNLHATDLVFPNWTWLEGAIAGLSVYEERDPAWLWKSFVSELRTVQSTHDIKPLNPWQEIDDSIVLSSLGGYVSVTGKIGGNGLRFPLPQEKSERIRNCLLGIDVVVHSHGITIPWKSIGIRDL